MKLNIKWDKILLVWNWGHKNMGDEIILVWNMKLLLNQWKKLYIACSNKNWIKNFHKQFIEKKYLLTENEKGFEDKNWNQVITYLQELPKGFRSTLKLLKNIKDLKSFFEVDTILIWWWEILTEETAWSYWYWFFSVWILLPFKNLYLSWGIQIPNKWYNRLVFDILMKKSIKNFIRDFDLLNDKNYKYKFKTVFFPDTSFFVYDDINYKNYTWNIKTEKENMIVVNINRKAEQFYEKIYKIVEENYNNWKNIYFAWICKSPKDNDIRYFEKLKLDFPNIKLLDWEDFYWFIKTLSKAESVYTTRLHLFLVSYYLKLNVVPFVYQKKVEKMKKVIFSSKQ